MWNELRVIDVWKRAYKHETEREPRRSGFRISDSLTGLGRVWSLGHRSAFCRDSRTNPLLVGENCNIRKPELSILVGCRSTPWVVSIDTRILLVSIDTLVVSLDTDISWFLPDFNHDIAGFVLVFLVFLCLL